MGQINQGGVTEGVAYLARHQTAGKGQRGKSWLAASGQSILMSIVLQPRPLSPANTFILNAAVAVGVFEFFKKFAGNDTSIKWSNDLYWCDRKAGGILIENIIRGNEWNYAVAGIGININQEIFPEDLPNPVSLKQITGKENNIAALAEELYNCIWHQYLQLKKGDASFIFEKYQESLYRKDIPARYKKGTDIFTGKIITVKEDGRLLMETDYKEDIFRFGEIEFLFD